MLEVVVYRLNKYAYIRIEHRFDLEESAYTLRAFSLQVKLRKSKIIVQHCQIPMQAPLHCIEYFLNSKMPDQDAEQKLEEFK